MHISLKEPSSTELASEALLAEQLNRFKILSTINCALVISFVSQKVFPLRNFEGDNSIMFNILLMLLYPLQIL